MANMNVTTINTLDLMEALHQAASSLDQAIQMDENYLDLSVLLQVQQYDQPTASGNLDSDYPGVEDPRIGMSSVDEIGSIKKIPLPPELVEQFGPKKNHDPNFPSNNCGLMAPELRTIQSSQTASVFGEMHLIPEPLFSIPSDNVHILSIRNADNGRIFMAGKDGCLYELHYQAEDGWFSRKCRKINHSKGKLSTIMMSFYYFSASDDAAVVRISIDNSRNILYTQSEAGTLQVFDMGEDGMSMSRVASLSQDSIVQKAALIAKMVDKSNFKPIIHIAAIPREESVNIHLVAVTHTGMRLYFTTVPLGNTRGRPYTLSLVHTRLPPGYSARAPPQRPSNVHTALYTKGTLMLAASQSEDSDLLWTIASDAFPFKKHLQETHEMRPLDGRTWAIEEVPNELLGAVPLSFTDGLKPDPPAVVTQHMRSNRKFVIINSQGSYILTKQNPSDKLRQLLLNFGPTSVEVEAYFQRHQEQAFATCLLLACNQSVTEQQVSELATAAFFRYGGDPKYNYDVTLAAANSPYDVHPGSGLGSVSRFMGAGTSIHPGMPNQISTPIPNVTRHMSFGYNTTLSGPSGGQASEVIFSNRFHGLCLYLARILRPIWNFRMVIEYPIKTEKGMEELLGSRCNSDDISWVLNKLKDLKDFVDRNSQFTSPLLSEGSFTQSLQRSPRARLGLQRAADGDDQSMRRLQAEADCQENNYLKQLQILINISCEALGLWHILCTHRFHIIVKNLTKEQQNVLRHMTFRHFVTQGKEMSHALITSLIGMYLNDNAVTDAISARLREVCPAFYSYEDHIYSKANEMLKTATGTQHSSVEREKLLAEALTKYKQISAQLDLPTVCRQFSAVRFYRGIVDLALTSAETRDPQGFAVHFYDNGEPSEDTQGMCAYRLRMDCYKCITETLDFLLSTSLSHPQSPSVPSSPGPPPAPDPNRLTNREAQIYVDEVFSLALKSQDKMFHICLYDWLIMKQLSEKLLEIQSPYLEPYLKRKADMNHLETLDLLWKYYEKIQNYAAAANILDKLAGQAGEIPLSKRMEYLSRAIMCAKGCTRLTYPSTDGEFLHQLEEKMEVAQLQLNISEALHRNKGIPEVDEALIRLNSQLIDINTLYAEFADRFDLSECKLAIIHCAGYHDPTMVEALWQDIIDKEFQNSQHLDTQARMKTLNQKLVNLGRIYATSEKCFPLAFLVKLLERRCCECNLDVADLSLVFRTLQDTGITLPRLHEIYDRLYKSKDFCWKTLKKPFHLLEVIEKLLRSFAESPNVVPAYDRRHFTTTSLDAIAFYLVELQSESTAGGTVSFLMKNFKDIQARLERFI
ncbi:hypothetical protein LSH36_1494g00009 [Paralvinella palmiformis]|uniref:Nuclear pore complex protein Nup155 n=1 Tax=Paralvinella palmiformis TaxID=53620 RepID=A0AAD9ISH4_9ANNE|nr:hypothetical protein LSH36_1494g00009 [Paralvinella palmiformis]